MQVNAAVYCRISRDKVGAGLGVERQQRDCEELAAKLGWTIVAVHADNDLSAYSGKPRPGYQDLLDDIRSQRVAAVLAWHTDRLHRSPAELETYIGLCEAHQVPTHCVKAGALDLATPSGRLVARQLGAVARYEVEHMIERTKRAKLQAAHAGEYRGGRRAFGYTADGKHVVGDEAAAMRDMARRVLAGESLRSIAASLNDRGITGTFGGAWTGASVREVLIRPRNAALVEHYGDIVGPALWPAVLDEDTWRAVRSVVTAPGRSRGKSAARKWLLSGLALCGKPGCGRPVKITSTRNGRTVGPVFHAYRCSGPAMHVSRTAERVDQLVTDTVLARLQRADARELVKPTSTLVDISALHEQANSLRAQLDELAILWAQKIMDTSQVAAASAELNQTLTEVDERIVAVTRPSPVGDLVEAKDIHGAWRGMSLDRQRAVIDELVDVVILPGRRGRKPSGIYFDPESVDITWKSR